MMGLTLVHITTVPETLNFFQGQIGYMKARGLQVHAVSSPGKILEEVGIRENIPIHSVNMEREITPLADLTALCQIYRLFKNIRPTIVHGHTPKGGLLGVIAARLARIPLVVYTMHGLPFVTARGIKRSLLIFTEKVSCRLSDQVFAVSFANCRVALSEGICPEAKIQVIGSGSCNGVDAAARYNPQKAPPNAREEIRRINGIPPEALVIGFIGRIVRDKGICELEEAWQLLRADFPNLFLMLVGPLEPQDPVPPSVIHRLSTDPRVRFIGRVNDPVPLYLAMDIIVLPTLREGFPITPLEAAAMEKPVVATKVDGCVEAVLDGITGLLVEPRNAGALAQALAELVSNPEKSRQMGIAGRQRMLAEFRPQQIWKRLYDEYMALMRANSVPPVPGTWR